MAITTIGDIVTGNIPVIASYQTQEPVEKTAFFQSGVLASTDQMGEIANPGRCWSSNSLTPSGGPSSNEDVT